MTRAFVGVGANLGDPVVQVRGAIAALAGLPQTRFVAASSLYRSAPLGYAAQDDFVNAACLLETALAPRALLGELRAIEAAAGRERPFKDAPRTLDLDLLLYGSETIDEPGLTAPHPRLHERAFALAPVVELDPDCVIPGRGLAREWLARAANQRIEKL
ncbi:MAG TPA: 2-amino-4-hydroxy-6-hydroxymethyldihydropteridine diphosphokinase [Burkholderiales bacterium]|nr:2-amino-4-hydroxy-6-hydroxymethyldihydropteridine diphosphokinase [Burkholderiales bacterium]